MATEITVIVDTDAGAARDYATLAAAIAGESGGDPVGVTSNDLVENDEQLTILLRASDGTPDGGNHFQDPMVSIASDAFVVDSTRFLNIKVDPAHRHTGVWNDSKYILQNAYNEDNSTQPRVFRCDLDYTRIEGLQFQTLKAQGTGNPLYLLLLIANYCRISQCIGRGIVSNPVTAGINLGNVPTGGYAYVLNNLVYNVGSGIYASQRYSAVEINGAVYNNTVINCSINGIDLRYNTGNAVGMYVRNNIVQDSGIDDYYANTGGMTTSNNISSDNTSFQSDLRSINLAFQDKNNNNYNLAETDTDAIDAGMNLSEDGVFAFNTDIIGTARPQGTAWDVGAFEYVADASDHIAISSTNTDPYSFYSTSGAGTNPITRTVELSQDSSPTHVESAVLTAYLISQANADHVKISAVNEDAGVEWQFSKNNSDWFTELTYNNVTGSSETPNVETIYIRTKVINDGTVTTNKSAASIKIEGWGVAT